MLIVDDEQSIRTLVLTVGEALGFVCLEADSGESALAFSKSNPSTWCSATWLCRACRAWNFSRK